jgi:ActD protein
MKRMLLVEFESSQRLAQALTELRRIGYRRLKAYTPYSTPEVRKALELPRSRLPIVVFAVGALGALGAYGLQWYLVGHLYPLDVGGRPPHMPLAFVPITFEMGVLLAGFTAFFGVFVLARLVRLWHPVFEVDGFESASRDRFWLRVDASDPAFDAGALASALERFEPSRSVLVGGEGAS